MPNTDNSFAEKMKFARFIILTVAILFAGALTGSFIYPDSTAMALAVQGLLSLLVTVVAGVLVYYFTHR